jgi:RNA polymerase sigma factor (sigma-70 family)
MLDEASCTALARRGAAGDGAACKELVEKLWPVWTSWVRRQRSLGPLAQSDDHVHEVLVRLVEKLGQPEGRGLRLYPPWQEQNPDKTFSDWVRIVTKNVVRDYAREQLGPRPADRDAPSLKRLLNDFASSPALEELGIRPPFTAAQTARELMEFAESRLPPEQLVVLRHWLEGASFEDTGTELGITPDAARKLVRSAVATLRREFGD